MSLSRSNPVPILQAFIDDLPVPMRARRWLQAAGVRTVGQLITRTEADLLILDNFSHTSLGHIKKFLSQHSLKLQGARPHDCTGSMIRAALADRCFKLEPRERQVIKLRHGIGEQKPRTLAEVGKKLKLTRERVRQIQKLAEQKVIAHHLYADGK
jgi:DNA-directed RNA polymerase sigma subunit (sigma70/sigma32)